MKQTVLFVILEQYADWEYSFLASALNDKIHDKTSPYEVKTLSVKNNPIKSLGGFTTIPDYTIETAPEEHAGLILIGGTSWRTEEAKGIAPLLKKAFEDGKVVGATCDATVFLGINGLLNERKHTSNTFDDLASYAGDKYKGKNNYQNVQAVRDGNLITANGTAYLEFTKECLIALDAYSIDYIEMNNSFYKDGYIETMRNMNRE